MRHFEELEVDLSSFLRQCPPSYFNNEGEENAANGPCSAAYGAGWDAFQKLLEDWRDQGELQGPRPGAMSRRHARL